MTTEKKEETSLGLKTKVRMDFILAMLPLLVGMIIMLVQQRQIANRLDTSWTVGNMAVWAKDLQYNNTTLHVPDPTEVKRMMEPNMMSSSQYIDPMQTVSTP